MQCRLYGRNAHIHDAADLLEGIAEYIHEDDAAALRHRKAHEGPQAGGGDLPIVRDGYRVDDHVRICVSVGGVLSGTVTQEIQCRIVSDAKQPGLWMRDQSRLGQCLNRFDDRLVTTSSPSRTEPVMRAQ